MEPRQTELTRIGSAISAALDQETDAAAQICAGRARLLDSIARRNAGKAERTAQGWLRRRVARPRPLLVVFGTMAAAVVIWVWSRAPISFHSSYSAASGRLGDLVEAVGPLPVALQFSEGSSVVLAENARARVLSVDRAGARVLLEGGAVDVAIVRRRWGAARWRFEAGPFQIAVTGTKFHVEWNPRGQLLSVQTSEGSVLVSGGCLDGARAVAAGDNLDVSCTPPGGGAADEADVVGPAPPSPPATKNAPVSSRPSPVDERWRKLVSTGHLVQALRAAESADFGHVCRTATQKELLALADAARLAGQTGRAVEALESLRRRFPRSPDSATAAFSLGRIAFERRAAYADAVRWFGAYLEEQPNGPLMGDAFGRLMEARQLAGDRRGARADARSYLRRFPDGPYAAQARALLAE